jgi:spore coat protein A
MKTNPGTSMVTRRSFLRQAVGTIAAGTSAKAAFGQHTMAMHMAGGPAANVIAPPMLDLGKLAPYVGALPVPPRIQPQGTHPDPEDSSRALPLYRVRMSEGRHRIHPALPLTRIWGYGSLTTPVTFPGPTFDVRKDEPVLVRWSNDLPHRHFLPIDHTICGAEADKPEVRAVPHLHGARVPHIYDGFPENWFPVGKSALYRYGNTQDACNLWYHDHAMGINRLNSYAGMMGMYLLRDDEDDALQLPSGKYEVPLVLCDRLIDQKAQWFYPVSGDPHSPWVPEFYGDAVLINGAYKPRLDVEPRPYRFRILNGANSRFFLLSLTGHAPMHQIGTDQGLMPGPVEAASLTIAPAERLDVILDFSTFKGQQLELFNEVFPILQFRVSEGEAIRLSLPKKLRSVNFLPESAAVRTRTFTLREIENWNGQPLRMLLDGKCWHDPISEQVRNKDIEIWEFANTTDDSHPIHLHLVKFQILDRRSFKVWNWINEKKMIHNAPPMPPEPSERGWKDTVRAEGKQVTRILVKFDGWPGRYAWHCHLLEHEANEMMRPFEILA